MITWFWKVSDYNIGFQFIAQLYESDSESHVSRRHVQLSFAYISHALTSGELTSLKSINETYQTTLGRQV